MNDSPRAVRHMMSSSRCVFRALSLHRDPRHPYSGVPSQGPSALGPIRFNSLRFKSSIQASGNSIEKCSEHW